MEVNQILELMRGVSENGITDFSYEAEGISLSIKKHPEKKIVPPIPAPMGMPPMPGPQNPAFPEHVLAEVNGVSFPQPQSDSGSVLSADSKIVKSPLVGTFYSAANPEEEPFVKVGDTVEKGQTLAIVEAMKLMNEIESEFDGVVKQILVKNGDLVEYDQPMFVIE